MNFITTSVVLVASLANMYVANCDFAYNTEISDNAVTSQTVYKKSENGLHLSHHLKYNFKYDEENRLVQKEVRRWNSITEKWENDHSLNFQYGDAQYTIELIHWDKKTMNYSDVKEKRVYNEAGNSLLGITSYKWNKRSNNWMLIESTMAYGAANQHLYAFENNR